MLRHFRDENNNQTYESGVDALLAEYDYTLQSDGRRTAVTETDNSGNQTQINWTYDNAGRLTRESYNSHDNSLDFITDYIFDLVGNRLSKKTDTNPTFLGDPTFDETVTNTHDANDRLLTETKDHLTDNSQDRHTAYTYDNTQQTQKTIHAGLDDTGTTLEDTTYAYNLQGRMSTVTLDTDGNGLPETQLTYEYNNRGIRTSQTKTTDGNNDGDFNDPEDTSTRTDYLVDNQNPTTYAQVLEEWLDGQLKTSYTLAHDVLTQAAITGAIHHLLHDGHGSTRMLVDALGLPLSSEIYRYDAYGNPIGFDPTQALTTLLYSGEQTDAATGFQYLRARYYDPAVGTFNRLDPFFGNLTDPLSLHKYLYVHDDPIQGIDPSGLFGDLSIGSLLLGSAIRTTITTIVVGGLSGLANEYAGGSFWSGFVSGSIGTLAFAYASATKQDLGLVAAHGALGGVIYLLSAGLVDWMENGMPIILKGNMQWDTANLMDSFLEGFAWGAASEAFGEQFKNLFETKWEWLPGASAATAAAFVKDLTLFVTGVKYNYSFVDFLVGATGNAIKTFISIAVIRGAIPYETSIQALDKVDQVFIKIITDPALLIPIRSWTDYIKSIATDEIHKLLD